MKIEVGKKYKTRGGKIVEIIDVKEYKDWRYPITTMLEEAIIRLTEIGTFYISKQKHELDLVEEIKEEETPIFFNELLEMSELQLEIIYKLIGNKKVVNLDESIAFFESIIKKAKNYEK